MLEITAQLTEIKKDLASNMIRNENFEKTVTSKIKRLEADNNYLRKQMNRADIIITGLPSTTANTHLYFVVIDLAKVLGVEIELSHINFCTWIGKKSGVLVKFNNVLIRDLILKSYRINYDLTLKQIMPTEKEDSRVYLNDHHTPIVSKFRYYCRKLVGKKIRKFEMVNWDIPCAKFYFLDGKHEEGDLEYVVKLNMTLRASNDANTQPVDVIETANVNGE